jgi:hypothetical protein
VREEVEELRVMFGLEHWQFGSPSILA